VLVGRDEAGFFLKKPPTDEKLSPRSLRISMEKVTNWPSSKPKDTSVWAMAGPAQ
jgi:hypothetical protein